MSMRIVTKGMTSSGNSQRNGSNHNVISSPTVTPLQRKQSLLKLREQISSTHLKRQSSVNLTKRPSGLSSTTER